LLHLRSFKPQFKLQEAVLTFLAQRATPYDSDEIKLAFRRLDATNRGTLTKKDI
jgi:hypothetical protein